MDQYIPQNEPGVQDATFSDFIGPAIVGGALAHTVPAAMGALPDLSAAIQAGLISAPTLHEAQEDTSPMEEIIGKFIDSAAKMGDWARVMQYKAIRAAIGETMTNDDAINAVMQVHADK